MNENHGTPSKAIGSSSNGLSCMSANSLIRSKVCLMMTSFSDLHMECWKTGYGGLWWKVWDGWNCREGPQSSNCRFTRINSVTKESLAINAVVIFFIRSHCFYGSKQMISWNIICGSCDLCQRFLNHRFIFV